MKKSVPLFAFCVLALLTACSSMPLGRLKQTDPENRAEIAIYRESSFNAGGVSLAVGIDGQAFATLGNSDYAAMFVRPGTYNFFVRARTAEPTTLKLEAKQESVAA